MISSLRTRLFIAILGTVVLAVGASLALGVVLTRNAVRDTIRLDLERQADASRPSSPACRLEAPCACGGTGRSPPGAPPGGPRRGARAARQPAPPRNSPGRSPRPLAGAGDVLPDGGGRAATTERRSATAAAQIAGAQPDLRGAAGRRFGRLGDRPDVVSGGDFSHYLSALLIASGVAALVAAAVAALLSRRLTLPAAAARRRGG